jgi:murein DD-endopeptidase MepM/ murein hydrolase activator NlpD
MASGTVVHVGPLWLNGPGIGRGPYSIVIDHGDSMYSTYGHNSKTIVKNGDKITAGQKIAEIGSLGYSSGPHLHLEVLENTKWTGNWKNPFLDDCDTTTKNLTLSQKLARAKYKNPLNYAKP